MTRMLASVTSLHEARVAVAAGADILDLKDPKRGALGALGPETIAQVVAAVGGLCPTSATVGDLPLEPGRIRRAVREVAGTGVDYVKVGLFAGSRQAACVAGLAPMCTAGTQAAGTQVVIVLFADLRPDFALLPLIAESGCAGVMLDTADKAGGGLRRHLDARRLEDFVEGARELGLLSGLAGSLGLADVPALLALRPDYLGFRGALCAGSTRTRALDRRAVERVRATIPREVHPSRNNEKNENEKYLFAVGTSVTGRPPRGSLRAEFPHTAPASGV